MRKRVGFLAVLTWGSSAVAQYEPLPPPPPPSEPVAPPPVYEAPPPPPRRPAGKTHPPPPRYEVRPNSDPGYHVHDGFFLRMAIGGGWQSASIGGDTTVSGAGGIFNLAAGGAINPNFAVHAEVFGMITPSPKVEVSGSGSGTWKNTDFIHVGIGPGFTYYAMPSNIYLSATIAMAKYRMVTRNGSNTSDTTYDSDLGWAVKGALGKEWWVSPNWGLGLAGQFTWVVVPSDSTLSSGKTTGPVIGLVFSATYN